MARSNKSIVTSISLEPELFQALQKMSRERKASASSLIAEFIQNEVKKRNKFLASQYAEAEQDPDRKALIKDLEALDDESWPDED